MDARTKLKQIYEALEISTNIVDDLSDEKVEYHLALYDGLEKLTTLDLLECVDTIISNENINLD